MNRNTPLITPNECHATEARAEAEAYVKNMFISVGRMVKYTGFGNAAGHLAQKGLLSGVRSAHYSSSSDDSDTEEYLEAQPNIDPVVGCTRPPRVNPFEGMTEEQVKH